MTTWIDLTDLTVHSGSVGGIERVEFNVIDGYLRAATRDGEDVRFFSYDEDGARFVAADVETVRARATAASAHVPRSGPSPRALQAIGLARKYLPEKVLTNEGVRRRARRTAGAGYRGLLSARDGLRRTARRAGVGGGGEQIQVAAGDTVVVLGKPWDRAGMSLALADLKRHTGSRLVVMVHDLIPTLHPHLHHPDVFVPYTTFLFELVGAADLVLTNSEATSADLLEFAERAGLQPPRIGRIRLGDDLPPVEPRRPDGIPDDFLLTVGTIEVRKNHALLYAVYRLAAEQGVQLPPLVIVGRPGWYTEDVRALIARDPAVQGRIIVRSGVSDAELAWLYRNCRFAVYPSVYEGWGLPVAEAAAVGIVTACSDAASIPEIAGPLLRYFSPYSAQHCLQVLQAYLEPAELEAARQGLRREYQVTTWDETARQARSLIRSR